MSNTKSHSSGEHPTLAAPHPFEDSLRARAQMSSALGNDI